MEPSLARRAADEFSRNNFIVALSLYRQLAELLGEKFFAANIQICQKRLPGSAHSSIYDEISPIISSTSVGQSVGARIKVPSGAR
jgi:hypothetical protein